MPGLQGVSSAKSPLGGDIDGGGKGKSARPFRMACVLGAPGCGKTTLVETLVEDAASAGRDVRILDPGGSWPGVGEWPERNAEDVRSPEERAEEWIIALRKERRQKGSMPKPMLVVLDDCDTFLGGGQPRGVWRDLFTTFRHWRVDLVLVARRTQDVPKICFTSASYVYLFTHREVGALGYMRSYIGASATKAIPQEPFRYVLVDIDAGELTEGKTKARTVRTAADGDSDGW